MAQRPASPSEKGPGPRARVPLLRDTEAQEQLSQCLTELAQEREAKVEAKVEAQEQLASLQQQLDAVSKGRQELRDQLDREQELSRELKFVHAQFLSAEAGTAKSLERLRNERNALQAKCNELKKARAPDVPPLGENNGRA
jgi:chromosome segregation ATPase